MYIQNTIHLGAKYALRKKNIGLVVSNANLMLSIELTDFLEEEKHFFFISNSYWWAHENVLVVRSIMFFRPTCIF